MTGLAQVDILGREFTRNPYPFYERIRATRVGILRPFDVYALARYEDVSAALRDHETYSSEAMYSFFETLRRTNTTALGRTMVSMNPPQHTVIRSIVGGILRERKSKDLSRYVTTLADGLLDRLADRDDFDVMADYAEPVALGVIAYLLGVGHERVGDFKRWTDDATANLMGASGEQLRVAEQNFTAMRDYFVGKIEQERAAPTNNFITGLVAYERRGELTPEQVLDAARFLLFAGNKTTRYFIGNATLALLGHPELVELVRGKPGRTSALVEELLRYDSPSQIAIRSVTRDVDFDGVTIVRGSVVFLLLGSANRDETKFPDPDRIDITRDASDHLGMGDGIHTCLGASVAKLESIIALRGLVARILGRRRVEVESLAYFPSLFLRGLSELRLTARAAESGV
jgi:cytochrome P450